MTGKVDIELESLQNAADRTASTTEEIQTRGNDVSAALHRLQDNFDGSAAAAIAAFTSQFDQHRSTIADSLHSIAQALHESLESYDTADVDNAARITTAGAGTEAGDMTNASHGDSDEPENFYDDDPRTSGGSVEEVNEWWENLSEDAQQEILENSPRSIAELDGIPFAVRHEANAALLQTELTELNEQIDNTDKGLPRTDQRAEYDNLVERRDALENLESKFERNTELMDNQEHLLLGFDSETDDVIMSIGNPDDADYMVSYTPGTGMSMLDTDRFNTEISRGSNIMDNMELEHGAGDDTAVVIYANFENPSELPEAMDEHYVTNGAEEYAQFNEGLNHVGDFEQHTAIGHSAGGAHVGHTAATQENFHADNVIYVASAGGGPEVQSADQLNADNVYSTMARSDFLDSQADPERNEHVHGGDPQSDHFGAETFHSENRGFRTQIFENHRGYFDFEIDDDGDVERNSGLENITDIAYGEGPS